jgi:hypothetical protein
MFILIVFCPEKTLTQVISHIHYFPVDWKGQAHTYKVRIGIVPGNICSLTRVVELFTLPVQDDIWFRATNIAPVFVTVVAQ